MPPNQLIPAFTSTKRPGTPNRRPVAEELQRKAAKRPEGRNRSGIDEPRTIRVAIRRSSAEHRRRFSGARPTYGKGQNHEILKVSAPDEYCRRDNRSACAFWGVDSGRKWCLSGNLSRALSSLMSSSWSCSRLAWPSARSFEYSWKKSVPGHLQYSSQGSCRP